VTSSRLEPVIFRLVAYVSTNYGTICCCYIWGSHNGVRRNTIIWDMTLFNLVKFTVLKECTDRQTSPASNLIEHSTLCCYIMIGYTTMSHLMEVLRCLAMVDWGSTWNDIELQLLQQTNLSFVAQIWTGWFDGTSGKHRWHTAQE
jgi:hypothetical protein